MKLAGKFITNIVNGMTINANNGIEQGFHVKISLIIGVA